MKSNNMWKKAVALGISFGMLISSMSAMAFEEEVLFEDDSYIVSEDDTEAMFAPETDKVDDGDDYIDQDFILEDEPASVEVEDDITLNSIIDETEAELFAASDGDIPIDEAHFPDEKFRTILSQKKYDSDENGVFSQEEISALTKLNIDDIYISSIEGINNFSYMTELDFQNAVQLKNFDVSGCTKLKVINCHDGDFTNLDVRGCLALETLQCNGCDITSLDVSDCYALKYLDVARCHLSNLDIRNCTSLEALYVADNQLTSLDVSKNTKLENLGCGNNQLTSLDVSRNTKLKEIKCNNNQLTSLDVSNCTQVDTLECTGNQLTYLNVSNCVNLRHLDCSSNQLTKLDLNGFTKLTHLMCDDNKLTSLDASNSSVYHIFCTNNQLKTLNVDGCPNLVTLCAFENDLASIDLSGCPNLSELQCYSNKLTSLDISSNTQLKILHCEANQIELLDISYCPFLIGTYTNGEYNQSSQYDAIAPRHYFYILSSTDFDWYGYLSFDYAVTLITTNSSFTVTYDANGGSGAPSIQTKKKDVALTLSSTQPTKNYVLSYNANGGNVSSTSKTVGCTFKTWNTAKDGSGTQYAPGASYTANASVTLYAQWINPTAGALATPTRTGYDFAGWFTSVSGGQRITESSIISSSQTFYAHWIEEVDLYNLGDETYSFENYGDSDSRFGHCFGMSITSAGYYNSLLNIGLIGGTSNSSLHDFRLTSTVKKPICKYQAIQGSYAKRAIVAGGSQYLYNKNSVSSDWQSVLNYVKNHQYDGTGLLQIGFRKDREGGHAINFLRYENVNGQDRIYAYDNNFPNVETYFYKDAYGRIQQAPERTFSGAIDCIALRDVRTYYNGVGDFDATHALYMMESDASVQGVNYSYMETDLPNVEYVMYEIPEDQNQVKIVPKEDNASFVYMDQEYSFGAVDDDTYGIFKLASEDEGSVGASEGLKVYNAPTKRPTQKSSASEKITIAKKPSIKKPAAAKGKITVKWKHFKHTSKKTKKIWKKIKKVQVQCATDKAFKNIVKTTTVKKSKTSAKIKGLKKKTTYYVRVRYYDGTGYSAWSKVKKVKTK